MHKENGRASKRPTRRPSSRVSDALAQVCLGTWPVEALSTHQVNEFVDAVRLHRIAPLAQVVTRKVAPQIARQLQEDRDDAFRRNLVASLLLRELAQQWHDISWVTFKGAMLSATAHPSPGLRTFTDIDALVAPSSLRPACERLWEAGWILLDFDDMLAARPISGELHWRSPQGMTMDLHWSMINRESRRARFRIPTKSLLERRRMVSIGFGEAPTLDPQDALIHVCVHSSLDGANRLLQLVDADGLARQITDWTTTARRAREWRAGAQVWLVLARSHTLLGTPLPDGLADLLGVSKAMRGFLALTDRMAPVTAARSEHGLARLVSRALHPTLGVTLAAISRNAAQGVRHRIVPPAVRQGRIPASQETLHSFLSEVERQPAS